MIAVDDPRPERDPPAGIVAEISLDANVSAPGEHGYMRIEVTLDCVDLDCTAAFWRAALGYDREDTVEGRFVSLTGKGPSLSLQRVPEPKTVKNRMHLDLQVDDIEAEVARLHALGATSVTTRPRQEFGQHWFVLADPEGNEFRLARDTSPSPETS